jgi:hypothetical protein
MGQGDIENRIASLDSRHFATLAAAAHAARHYSSPTDTDLARDLNRSARTIRRHRKRIGLAALSRPGRPRKAA